MVDENAGQDDKYNPANEPNQESTYPEVMPTPVSSEHDHKDSAAHHQEPEDKNNPTKWETFHERLKKVGFHDWVMLAATIAIAISTTLYTIYAHGQLDTMQKTLAEMKRNGSTATDQTWQTIGNMNWLAREMNYARDQSRDAAKTGERDAKAVLDASIEASRNEQRAWISITDIRLQNEPTPARMPIVAFVMLNSGKTPALNLRTKFSVAVWKKSEPPAIDWSQVPVIAMEIAFPQAHATLETPMPPLGSLNQQAVDAYQVGGARFYFRCRADYDDVFKRHHWVDVCYHHIFGKPLTNFESCTIGGSIDNNR